MKNSKINLAGLKMKKKIIFFLFCIFLGVVTYSYLYNEFIKCEGKIKWIINTSGKNYKKFYNFADYRNVEGYIAHGGGVDNYVYLNCREGVLDAIQKGFKFIELDLQITIDNVIIAAHSWKDFKEFIGIDDNKETALSYNDIKERKIKGKYSILTGKDITQIMNEYHDFYLVTDKITDYKILLQQIPLPDRVLVEVFSFKDYLRALQEGIFYPIMSLPTINEKLYKKIIHYKIPMLAISSVAIVSSIEVRDFCKKLHEKGVIIFCYSFIGKAKEPEYMKENMGKIFSKFYVDEWYPDKLIKLN